MGDAIRDELFISVIIPNRNGAATIGKCIEAALRSEYKSFEVVVVDDCSTDGSADIIRNYPCRLIALGEHSGAAGARNEGARASKGEALFFIDADCILRPDSVSIAAKAFRDRPGDVTGGTYAPISHDGGFFSTFQSLFINYSETKSPRPDYVATHAMVISRKLFEESGGLDEEFMPILEDVEFSHRLRRMGVKLRMQPALQVEHIFNFNLWRSLKNAFRKSLYWTAYSIKNRDLLKDSGTASIELKADVLSWYLCASMLVLFTLSGEAAFIAALALTCSANLFVNRRFIVHMLREAGPAFAVGALLYYAALYPLPVAAGGFVGALRRT